MYRNYLQTSVRNGESRWLIVCLPFNDGNIPQPFSIIFYVLKFICG